MVLSFITLLALACEFSVAIAAPPHAKVDPPNILWDGRIPPHANLTDFDSYSTSRYGAEFVLGTGQKWSEVLKLPKVMGSRYDVFGHTRPFEVTINDKSIFNNQTGFRRSELIPISNNGKDATVQGITTFRFSMRLDASRPLNFSHQYELVFIETNDFKSHVWTIKAGSPFGASPLPSPESHFLRLEGSTAGGKEAKVLFQVGLNSSSWHNWAITTDWDNNSLTAYHSDGFAPYTKVVETTPNDATGKGQAHIGILKLPTGSTDPSQNGFQQRNFTEGIIYGGVFVTKGSVSQ